MTLFQIDEVLSGFKNIGLETLDLALTRTPLQVRYLSPAGMLDGKVAAGDEHAMLEYFSPDKDRWKDRP